jgi:hypothetical protein
VSRWPGPDPGLRFARGCDSRSARSGTQANTSQCQANSSHTDACRGNDPFSFPLTFPRTWSFVLRLALQAERNGLETVVGHWSTEGSNPSPSADEAGAVLRSRRRGSRARSEALVTVPLRAQNGHGSMYMSMMPNVVRSVRRLILARHLRDAPVVGVGQCRQTCLARHRPVR